MSKDCWYVCEFCGDKYPTDREAIQCCDVLRQEDEDIKNTEQPNQQNNMNKEQTSGEKWVCDQYNIDSPDCYQNLADAFDAGVKHAEEWIRVKDRLPYFDGDSSIYCLVVTRQDGIVVRPYNEHHKVWDQEDGDDTYCEAIGGKVTHWKELPPLPPKPEIL